jgi:hypothetical protein
MAIAHIQEITDRKRPDQNRTKLENQARQPQKMESIGLLAGGRISRSQLKSPRISSRSKQILDRSNRYCSTDLSMPRMRCLKEAVRSSRPKIEMVFLLLTL